MLRMTALGFSGRNSITESGRKRKLGFEWQHAIRSLKGQAGTGGPSFASQCPAESCDSRADTAGNIRSLGSLEPFGRSF